MFHVVRIAARSLLALASCLLLLLPAQAAPSRATQPQARLVEVPNGSLRLKGLLWLPASCRRCPAILFNHGRSGSPQQHVRDGADRKLGPIFARHGYVFLWLYRRGEGLSADQGAFIGDLLESAEQRSGAQARDRLQVKLLTTDHLSDGMAGIAFLRRQPQVDAHRIAVVGHSFGGQLSLLEAERDASVRAVVAFGPGAGSWTSSPLLRQRLISAGRKIAAPVMILHAQNDYSTEPGKVLDAERARLGKPHMLEIYPAVGRTAEEGHSFLYSDPAIWETDVFHFLDRQLSPRR
jgi:carboxymethylenebutenolidase